MDLVKEFFKRDLSEAEEQNLARKLEAFPEEALRLLEGAEAKYRAYGLPEPRSPRGAGAWSGWLKFAAGLASGLLLAILLDAMGSWAAQEQAAPQAPSERAPAAERERPGHPARAARRPPEPKAVPEAPKPRPTAAEAVPALEPLLSVTVDVQTGSMLFASLEIMEASPLVVSVLDSQGRELSRLYEGRAPAGKWGFRWDGKLKDGSLARSGSYVIEARAGRFRVRRMVNLEIR